MDIENEKHPYGKNYKLQYSNICSYLPNHLSRYKILSCAVFYKPLDIIVWPSLGIFTFLYNSQLVIISDLLFSTITNECTYVATQFQMKLICVYICTYS